MLFGLSHPISERCECQKEGPKALNLICIVPIGLALQVAMVCPIGGLGDNTWLAQNQTDQDQPHQNQTDQNQINSDPERIEDFGVYCRRCSECIDEVKKKFIECMEDSKSWDDVPSRQAYCRDQRDTELPKCGSPNCVKECRRL